MTARGTAPQGSTKKSPASHWRPDDVSLSIGARRSRARLLPRLHDFAHVEALRLRLVEQAAVDPGIEARRARQDPQERPIGGADHGVIVVRSERDNLVVAPDRRQEAED